MTKLLLKGGRVIDPASDRDDVFDVLIDGGLIAAIGVDLDTPACAGAEVVDCRGRLVLPGLIDTHAHVFQGVTGRFGLNPDLCGVRSGVTTLVDQGGASCITLPGFRQYIVEPSRTRVLSFLSAYLVGGLEGHYYPELYRPECLDVEATVKAARGNGDLVREVCLSSELRAATAADLAAAGVQCRPVGGRVIDDFAHGWQDWYRNNVGNPVLWQNWTRKVTDPAWRGPDGAALAVTLTVPKTNRITVVVIENEWRGERGPRRTFLCTREVPGAAAPQTLSFTPADFVPTNEKYGPLRSWAQLDVLGICGFFAEGQPAQEPSWDGPLPEFHRVEW
jgi:hypothetical protein